MGNLALYIVQEMKKVQRKSIRAMVMLPIPAEHKWVLATSENQINDANVPVGWLGMFFAIEAFIKNHPQMKVRFFRVMDPGDLQDLFYFAFCSTAN